MNTNANSGSAGFKFQKFIKNKNTITALSAIMIVVVLVIGYNMRVNSAVEPVKVPYAKVTIQPRTEITSDMIGYVTIAKAGIQGEVITDARAIVNNYTNYNTVIPAGSLFYKQTVVEKKTLPDSALFEVPKGYTLYYLSINMLTSYSNSMLPGNFIDLYISSKESDGKALFGKLMSNIKILAVKTSDGKHVFEDSGDNRVPSVIIFAVPEEYHILLRKVESINSYNVYTQSIKITPVPNNVYYTETELGNIKPNVTSNYLKEFIEEKATKIPADVLENENQLPGGNNSEGDLTQ